MSYFKTSAINYVHEVESIRLCGESLEKYNNKLVPSTEGFLGSIIDGIKKFFKWIGEVIGKIFGVSKKRTSSSSSVANELIREFNKFKFKTHKIDLKKVPPKDIASLIGVRKGVFLNGHTAQQWFDALLLTIIESGALPREFQEIEKQYNLEVKMLENGISSYLKRDRSLKPAEIERDHGYKINFKRDAVGFAEFVGKRIATHIKIKPSEANIDELDKKEILEKYDYKGGAQHHIQLGGGCGYIITSVTDDAEPTVKLKMFVANNIDYDFEHKLDHVDNEYSGGSICKTSNMSIMQKTVEDLKKLSDELEKANNRMEDFLKQGMDRVEHALERLDKDGDSTDLAKRFFTEARKLHAYYTTFFTKLYSELVNGITKGIVDACTLAKKVLDSVEVLEEIK